MAACGVALRVYEQHGEPEEIMNASSLFSPALRPCGLAASFNSDNFLQQKRKPTATARAQTHKRDCPAIAGRSHSDRYPSKTQASPQATHLNRGTAPALCFLRARSRAFKPALRRVVCIDRQLEGAHHAKQRHASHEAAAAHVGARQRAHGLPAADDARLRTSWPHCRLSPPQCAASSALPQCAASSMRRILNALPGDVWQQRRRRLPDHPVGGLAHV